LISVVDTQKECLFGVIDIGGDVSLASSLPLAKQSKARSASLTCVNNNGLTAEMLNISAGFEKILNGNNVLFRDIGDIDP
jgi:hypothetical protein